MYSGYALDEEGALVFVNVIKKSKVVFSDFNLDNYSFRQGMCKIAYNYAIYLGIDPKAISDIYDIELSGENKELSSIKFKGDIIPFVAGNKLDEFIELNSEFKLFHNLILFEYNNELWCYYNFR